MIASLTLYFFFKSIISLEKSISRKPLLLLNQIYQMFKSLRTAFLFFFIVSISSGQGKYIRIGFGRENFPEIIDE